jgi:hypothetical protein
MRKIGPGLTEVRVEVVTTAFVASGRPEGIHDLGRFLENLNNPALTRQIELKSPAVRPLYRATAALHLEAPLIVRREDIIFANFEGPHLTRGVTPPPVFDVPVLLMAPPFQIQGVFAAPQDADVTQALRLASQGFFVVRETRVYDADGAPLGEGDRIVVNGASVQMLSASRQHISMIGAVPNIKRDAPDAADEPAAAQDGIRAA